jgi:hypothetical protein
MKLQDISLKLAVPSPNSRLAKRLVLVAWLIHAATVATAALVKSNIASLEW